MINQNQYTLSYIIYIKIKVHKLKPSLMFTKPRQQLIEQSISQLQIFKKYDISQIQLLPSQFLQQIVIRYIYVGFGKHHIFPLIKDQFKIGAYKYQISFDMKNSHHITLGHFRNSRRQYLKLYLKIKNILSTINSIKIDRVGYNKVKNPKTQQQKQQIYIYVNALSSEIQGQVFYHIHHLIKENNMPFGAKNNNQYSAHFTYGHVPVGKGKQILDYVQKQDKLKLKQTQQTLMQFTLATQIYFTEPQKVYKQDFYLQKQIIGNQLQKIDKMPLVWLQQIIKRNLCCLFKQDIPFKHVNKIKINKKSYKITYKQQKCIQQGKFYGKSIKFGRFNGKRKDLLHLSHQIKNILKNIQYYRYIELTSKTLQDSKQDQIICELSAESKDYQQGRQIFRLIHQKIMNKQYNLITQEYQYIPYIIYGYVEENKGPQIIDFLCQEYEVSQIKQQHFENENSFEFQLNYQKKL